MAKFTIIWNTSGDVSLSHVEAGVDAIANATISDYAKLVGVEKSEECDLVILAVFEGHIHPNYSILATG